MSPVRPSNRSLWPDVSRLASVSMCETSASRAPSNTGVAIGTPFLSRPAISTISSPERASISA